MKNQGCICQCATFIILLVVSLFSSANCDVSFVQESAEILKEMYDIKEDDKDELLGQPDQYFSSLTEYEGNYSL